MDKEKLDKLKKEYDPFSEINFKSDWNTDNDFSKEPEENNDKIVEKLYEDLSNLTLEDSKEDSPSEKEDDPVAAAKCPPILGGQVSSKSRPSGMARNMTLGLTNKTSSITTTTILTPSSSTTTSTPSTQIIHEENCSCPCRQKLKFSANVASVRTTTNGKTLYQCQ